MMYKIWKDVWIGKMIPSQGRILILGESHYGTENGPEEDIGKEVPYPTSGVVESHLSGGNTYEFFNKIAATFGYAREDIYEFYNKVFFANYIPVLYGRKNNSASDFISKDRKKYNNDLFEFVNKYRIDTIVCYSRRSYNALPGLEKGESAIDIPIGRIAGKKNLAGVCNYINGVKHMYCEIELQRPLIVYGFRHPSSRGGFNIQQVYDFLKRREDEAIIRIISFRYLHVTQMLRQ